MEKRYQVFVSSTYEDLREERQEVIQALRMNTLFAIPSKVNTKSKAGTPTAKEEDAPKKVPPAL